MDRVLFVDNTLLSGLVRCSTQAAVRHILHRVPVSSTSFEKPFSSALAAGFALHRALAALLGGESEEKQESPFQEYEAVGGAELLSEDIRSLDSMRFTWASWKEVYLPRFFGERGFFSIPQVPQFSPDPVPLPPAPILEKPISAELCRMGLSGFSRWATEEPIVVRFVGLLDALVQERGSGQFGILDHKITGSNLSPYYENSFLNSSQLKGYLWLASKQEGAFPSSLFSAWIHAIQLKRRPSGVRKCKNHGLSTSECAPLHVQSRILGPFSYSPLELEDWRLQAIRLVSRYIGIAHDMGLSLDQLTQPAPFSVPSSIKEVQTTGQFGYRICSSCEYSGWCRRGRAPEELERTTQVSLWTPQIAVNADKRAEE